MRVKFDHVFTVDLDGTIEPRQWIRISGMEVGPGVRFRENTVFGGIDLAAFKNHDLEVKKKGGLIVITGVFGFYSRQKRPKRWYWPW